MAKLKPSEQEALIQILAWLMEMLAPVFVTVITIYLTAKAYWDVFLLLHA